MEIPRPPDGLVEALRKYDRRLGLRFNADVMLWEVFEHIERTGLDSHCMYWADGGWRDRKFKALPPSADPILAKLAVMDWEKSRHLGTVKHRLTELKNRGAHERARRLEQVTEVARKRVREYMNFCGNHWETWRRGLSMGGDPARRAVESRRDAYKEILNDGNPLEPDLR